jgi:hypothetical protein
VIKGAGEKVSDKRKQRHTPESELFNDINGLARVFLVAKANKPTHSIASGITTL